MKDKEKNKGKTNKSLKEIYVDSREEERRRDVKLEKRFVPKDKWIENHDESEKWGVVYLGISFLASL